MHPITNQFESTTILPCISSTTQWKISADDRNCFGMSFTLPVHSIKLHIRKNIEYKLLNYQALFFDELTLKC